MTMANLKIFLAEKTTPLSHPSWGYMVYSIGISDTYHYTNYPEERVLRALTGANVAIYVAVGMQILQNAYYLP